MTFTKRFVALGDSFTEGVGDYDPTLPNGVRGWADRVAEQLMLADSGWGYANLAIRGKKIAQVLDEQVDAAVGLKPTMVTLYAGGNDILRPRVDIDALMAGYEAGVAKLAATGANVVLFTGFDSVASAVFGKTRGRTAIYNEWVREIADLHGAKIVDYWRMREFRDWRYWDADRLHMSTAGHTLMAKKVLELLQAEDVIDLPMLPDLAVLSRRAAMVANVRWARDYLGPWIGRRLRGTSSGDSLTPKYAQLTGLHATA
ncbi:SGNH/GDSL hydrolase family protein [Arthrobacter sp. NPDC089319]|uniref:SGNH/GDSL hydrolase family protein n=1 Tax=Arthrobacter sp. NPDC089319 TaxID=3155915 RepID=UPI00341DD1E0